MAELVTITIDGVEVSVPKGTVVVDAARKIGNDIPVFCYHPKMEPVGMCRMCLVEIGVPVIDRATGQPAMNPDGTPQLNFGKGLQTGCTVRVSPGMVVRTATKAVETARDDVIEFLLTSHPLDCPICDKGGECPLQNLTMAHGAGTSRFNYENKMQQAKHVPLGELITLDRERCIQCARCTRFQDEIVDDPVITFHNRGRALEIVTFSEPGFDSYWSGNTTDLCPVGALTSSDFRFGARAWELNPVASVCNHCPVGCNTTLSTRAEAKPSGNKGKEFAGRRVIKRVMPRQNESVNEIWICDKGRFVHHFADSPERLRTPLIRRDGELVPASWDEALELVARKLGAHKGAVAGLAGDRLSNEDLFSFQRLIRGGLGSNDIDVATRHLGGGDVVAQVGIASGSSLGELGKGDAILVVAADLHEEAPVWWLRAKQAAQRGATLVVLNLRPTRMDKFATHAIQYRPGEALSLVRQILTAARVDTGGAGKDAMSPIADALMKANNLVAFYGGEGLSYAESEELARALGNLLLTKREDGEAFAGKRNSGLIPVWHHGNSQGAWDMGIHPAMGPGFAPLAQPGRDAYQIAAAAAEGSLGALLCVGTDPIGDGLMADRGSLDFLVVQELFLTLTAEEADVVLPAQSWAEREGTYTNGERRVQRFFPAIETMFESRADWQILAQIGERLGMGKVPAAASLVFKEIAAAVPQYKGMDYRVLAQTEEQWPIIGRSDLYYGGTAYDNTQGLGKQYAAAAESNPVEAYELGPERTADVPAFAVLLTPALYTPGTLIDETELLQQRMAEPTVFVNPADAGRDAMEIFNGELVAVYVDGEMIEAFARVGEETPAGLALLRGVRGSARGELHAGEVRKRVRGTQPVPF